MDPVDLIIASLKVKGAFPDARWLPLEAVRKRMGLPFTTSPPATSAPASTQSALEQASAPSQSRAAGSPKEEQKAPSCTSS